MRCCATCDLVEINSVPACTDSPLWLCPLWPQRQGYSLQNMWLADCVTQHKVGGCIHRAVTSSKQCCFGEGSFCLEGVRLILWKCAPHRGEEGTYPPTPSVLWLSWPPLLIAPLPDNWSLSRGGQQGWVISMQIHPATPWKHGEDSWEAWARSGQSTLRALCYATVLCLIVGWHSNEYPS